MNIFKIDKTLIQSEQLPHEDTASIVILNKHRLLDTYNKLLNNDTIDIDVLNMSDILKLIRMDILLLSKRTIYVGSPIIKVSILLHQYDDYVIIE